MPEVTTSMSNVRDFGAKGDGTTDDTEAIQHAVEQGDGNLVLPRGTYRITRSIRVDLGRFGPLAVHGSSGTARLRMDGPAPALHIVGSHDKTADPEDFRPGVWERERMPTIEGLEIVGNHDQAIGIALEGTMQATIRGVLVRRCRIGLHLVKRNRNLLLADSHFYHGRAGGIGVYFDGVNLHQANIVGCHISYWPHAGIKIVRSEVRNLQITGCDIEYNFDPNQPDSADVWIDSREGTVREGTIASNTIQAKNSPGGCNVRIEGRDIESSSAAGLWTISGNVLQSQAVNLRLRSCRAVVVTGNSFASGFGRSIVLDRCRHVSIGTNTFDHNPDYQGERMDGILIRDSHGVTLSGLILEDARGGSPEGGEAIGVLNSREVAILGCQILDPAHRGIGLTDVSNSRVSDCTILDRRDPRRMQVAIQVEGRGRGNLIQNNLIGSGTVETVRRADGAGVVLEGNTIVE
jgi:hypothetical protein